MQEKKVLKQASKHKKKFRKETLYPCKTDEEKNQGKKFEKSERYFKYQMESNRIITQI